MNGKMPLRIRYEYEQTEDSRAKYAHGVWGGVNPMGEIEINFYFESDKIPAYTESVVTEDGRTGPEVAPDEGEVKTVVRQIQSRVIMNSYTARAMLEWLEEQVEAVEGGVEGFRYFDSGVEQ